MCTKPLYNRLHPMNLNRDEGFQTLLYPSTRDLLAFCLCCKALRRSATTILYHRVTFLLKKRERGPKKLVVYDSCNYQRQLIFYETILAQPRLWSLVHELSWTIAFPAAVLPVPRDVHRPKRRPNMGTAPLSPLPLLSLESGKKHSSFSKT